MSYLVYAEDDPDDQLSFKDMFKEIDPYLRVVLVPTGLALMQYLDTLAPQEEWPCFIVLDMNMPVWDGIRTLQAIKQNDQYAHLPVIVFSTSRLASDAALALEHGAVSFISKPTRQAEVDEVVRKFVDICRQYSDLL